ncbi:MAG: hypothetical protein AAF442_04340 [Pseudomonadota bacterium]
MTSLGIIGLGVIGREVLQQTLAPEDSGEASLRAAWVLDRSPDKTPAGMDQSKRAFLSEACAAAIDLYETIDDLLPALAETDVVIEATGDPNAWKIFQAIMDANPKIRFVTANKAMIAHHSDAFFHPDLAHRVGLEAAVAAGLPLIQSVTHHARCDQIDSLVGILNGTTNFVLTEMEKGSSLDDSLKRAITHGYAEPGGKGDIDGLDATFKLAILLRLALNQHVAVDKLIDSPLAHGIIPHEDRPTDIRDGVRAVDMLYARHYLNCAIRHIGLIERHENSTAFWVGPALVPTTSALGTTFGARNTVTLHSRYLGDIVLQGEGAGPAPTASVLRSDAMTQLQLPSHHTPPSTHKPDLNGFAPPRWMVRFCCLEGTGILSYLFDRLQSHGLQIDEVFQFRDPALLAQAVDSYGTLALPKRKVTELRPTAVTLNQAPFGQVLEALHDAFSIPSEQIVDDAQKNFAHHMVPALADTPFALYPILDHAI